LPIPYRKQNKKKVTIEKFFWVTSLKKNFKNENSKNDRFFDNFFSTILGVNFWEYLHESSQESLNGFDLDNQKLPLHFQLNKSWRCLLVLVSTRG